MDYLKFDLQLFAEAVTVDLTDVASAMTTGTKYLVVGDPAPEWKAAGELTAEDSIIAQLNSGVLTVAATADGANIAVTNATAAQLQGVTFKVVQTFAYNSETKQVTETNPADAAVTGTFTLATIQAGLTAAVQSAKTEDPATAATTAKVDASGNLSIMKGVIVTANGIAYTAEAASVLALAEKAEANKPATLVSGSVQVAAEKAIVANTGETITGSTAGKTLIVTMSGTGESQKAVVSGFSDEGAMAFTVTDASVGEVADATPTTYTIGTATDHKADIVVSGDQVGTYKAVTVAQATVTLASGADKVQEPDSTDPTTMVDATLATIGALPITAGTSAGTYKRYYELKWDSESKAYTITAATSQAAAPTISNTILGYFDVTTNPNGGDPTATVKFYSATDTEGLILGDLPVTATDLKKVGSDDITKLIVTGVASGDVTVDGLYHTATVDGATTTHYEKYYLLDETSDTITVAKKDAAADTYFLVTASGGTDDVHGEVTYKITQYKPGAGDPATPADTQAYFRVAATKAGEDPVNYAITFHGNATQAGEGWKNGPQYLDDACWAGIKVKADDITAGKLTITGDTHVVTEVEQTHDAYAVSLGYGTQTTITQAAGSTTKYTGTPTYTISGTIETPDGSSAKKEYWTVVKTTPNNDGQPTLTIAKATGATAEEQLANAQKFFNYFTVTVTAKDGDTKGKVEIAYTSGSGTSSEGTFEAIGLTNIGKKIPVTATALDPANTASISIADGVEGAPTRVDYAVTVSAGVVVTTNDGAILNEENAASTSAARQTVTFDTSFDNGVVVPLADADTSADGKKTFFRVVLDGDRDETTGYQKVKLGAKIEDDELTAGSPATTENYVQVVWTETGNKYAVSYHKGEGGEVVIDLTDSTKGQLAVDVDGLAETAEVDLVYPGEADNVATWGVVNASGTMNFQYGKDGGSLASLDDKYVEYVPTFSWKTPGNGKLTLTDTKYFTLTDTTGAKGAHTYEIGAATDIPEDITTIANRNYFTVTLSEENKKATIAYHAGSGNGAISLADLVANLAAGEMKVPVDANGTTITALVLTDDKGGKIDYAVANIPYTVDVTNSGAGDDLHYVASYVLDGTKNTITLEPPAGAKTVYYKVTASGGESDTKDKGRWTYAISTDAIDDADLAKEAKRGSNYFTVATTAGGDVTIEYTHGAGTPPYDFDGFQVKVDGAKSTGNIKVGKDGSGDDSIKFAVTGLDKGQNLTKTNAASSAIIDEQDKVYNPSVEITNADGTAPFDGIALSAGEKYYSVTRVPGNFASQGVTKYEIGDPVDALNGAWKAYFKVTVNSDYKVSVTYVNKESSADYDLSAIGQSIKVSATGLAGTVDTIDITDDATTKSVVNYELVNVPSRIPEANIIGKHDGDTVAYVASEIKVTGTIALPESGTANYVINSDKTISLMTEAPTDSDNYFAVAQDEVGNYTIKYNAAKNGAVYTIDNNSTLTVDASAAKSLAGITTTNAAASVEITKAPGGASFTGANTKITYETTFAWTDGIYYIPVVENEASVEVGATMTTKANDDEHTFIPVSVTRVKDGKGEYTGEVAVKVLSTQAEKTGADGIPEVVGGAYGGTIVLDVANVVTVEDKDLVVDVEKTGSNLDVTGIVNVPAGAKIAGLAVGKTATTISTLTSGAKVTVNGIEYTAGAAGQLVIKGVTDLDHSGVQSGVVTLKTVGAEGKISGGAANWDVTLDETVVGADAGVTVTFKNGEIDSIVGLDEGEKVTVNKGGTQFTYSYEDGYIRQYAVAGGTKTYSGAASATSDIMHLDYGAKGATVPVDYLSWSNGTWYSAAAATSSGTLTLVNYKAKDESRVAEDGKYYAKLAIAEGVLTLSVVKGNAQGGVDPATDFTGTIELTPGIPVTYTSKAATDGFTVKFTGVKGTSTFNNLGANDTITTAEGALVTVGGVNYQAADGEALAFEGLKITDGVVDLAASQVQKVGNCTIEYTAGAGATDGVQVTYDSTKTDGIATITGLSKGEKVVITTYAADGVKEKTVTYTADGDDVTKVTRETEIDGKKTDEDLTITAGGDILSGTVAAVSVKNNFSWTVAGTHVGYFIVDGGAVTIPASGAVLTKEVTFHKNDRFIQAKTEIADDVATLTLIPMVVTEDGTMPVEDTAGNLASVPVNIVAGATPVSYTAASGKVYSVHLSALADGSEVTLGKDDTAISAAFASTTAAIKVNGTTFTSGINTSNTIAVTFDGTAPRVTGGTIVAKGTTYSRYTDAQSVVHDVTLAYTKGTTGTEGVIVAYGGNTNNGITSITGLDAGESVTITDGSAATKYEAHTGSIFWKYENGTVTGVKSGASTGTNLMGDVFVGLDPQSAVFDWGKTDTGKTGYFLISDNAAKTAEIAAGITTTTYQQVGRKVLVATIDNENVLTLAKKEVDADGSLKNDTLANNDVLALSIALPTTKAVKYQKATITSAAVTVTNAVTGSVFSDFGAADKVSTIAAFKAGDSVKIGAKDSEVAYTAAADGQLVISGDGKAYGGVFAVTTAVQFNAYGLSDDKTATTDSITYTASAGTGEKDGVSVTVTAGEITGVTGLGNDEQILVKHQEITKSGAITYVETTYSAKTKGGTGSDKDYLVVTKNEVVYDKAGGNIISDKTYKQEFASNKADVVGTTTGWNVSQETTTTAFDWGATDKGAVGYFAATVATSGDDKGKFTATITKTQSSTDIPSTWPMPGNQDRYYLRATAEQALSGDYTVSDLQLVYLEDNGSWTKLTNAAQSLTVHVPDSGNVTFAAHDYALTVDNAQVNGVYTGLLTTDTIETVTLTDGAKVTVGSTEYTSGAAAKLTIRGDGAAVVSGTVKTTTETSATFTSAKNGTTVEYTKGESGDGVVVTFADAANSVTSITGLDQKTESVVVTEYKTVKDSKGNPVPAVAKVTTYTYDGTNTLRTIEADGVVETAAVVGAPDLITGSFVPASKFDWGTTTGTTPDGRLGYFQISGSNIDKVDTQTALTPLTFEDNAEYVRVVASDGKITSLSLYKYTTAGGFQPLAPEASAYNTVKIKAPGNLELASDAITLTPQDADDLSKGYYDRTFFIEVAATASGQVFKGLSELDSVTASLGANETVTVNGVKYTTAAISDVAIRGDGLATEGNFALTTANGTRAPLTIASGPSTIAIAYTAGAGARVNVAAGGVLSGITYFSTANEALTVTETTWAGVVTTTTYKVSGGKVEKTVVADGVTTKYTSKDPISGESDNILTMEYDATGNVTTTSQFNWTAAGNSGYFAVAATTDKLGAVTSVGTATVAEQTKPISITKAQKDAYYLKVTPNFNNTISEISLVQVQSDGSLKEVTVPAAATGTLNITAPSKALTFDALTVVNNANIAVNITGAAAGSIISLQANDTLTTANLDAGDEISVNSALGTNFKAGASGALKFLGGAILSSGAVQLVNGTFQNFVAAGADNAAAATDNVTVALKAGATSKPVVTVKNGVITAISGLENAMDTVTTTEATSALQIVYQMDDTPANGGKLNAAVTSNAGTAFSTAALADGATVTVDSGTPLENAAANGTLSLVKEGAAFVVKDGMLRLDTTGETIKAMSTSSTEDDVTVAYTTCAAGAGLGDVVVTVKDGKVTGLKGLGAGDTVTVTEKTGAGSVATTYVVNSAGTTVTKTVGGVEKKANIAVGGDVWNATYIGGGSIFDEDEFTGQLSFDPDIVGRNKGYFVLTDKTRGSGDAKVTYKISSIYEQTKEETLKAPAISAKAAVGTKSEAKYLEAIFDGENKTLAINGIKVTSTKKYVDPEDTTKGTYIETTTDALEVESTTAFSANDMVTITAPADKDIVFDKGKAVYGLTINKLAAGSTISGIDAGDTVTTTSLVKGDGVTMIDSADNIGYRAAGGVLTFKGTGDGTKAPAENVTQLYSGTILMSGTEAAKTYGGGTTANPIAAAKLTAATVGTDVLTVAVKNGVVSSVTGLATQGSKLTVGTVVYEVLYADSTNVMVSRKDGAAAATFASFKATTGNFYSETGSAYEAAGTITSNLSWKAGEKTTTTYGVTLVGNAAALNNAATDTTISVANAAATAALDPKDPAAVVRGSYFLQATVSTTAAAGVSTITAVDVMQVQANGSLKKVTNAYKGTVTIDGVYDTTKYATINATKLPVATKRDWSLAVQNVALGSTFGTLGDTDQVTTNAGNWSFKTNGKTVTTYKANGVGTDTRAVTYKGSDDANIVVNAAGVVTNLTGLEKHGETVTIITKTAAGEKTDVYAAAVKNNVTTVTRTTTDVNGKKTVATATNVTSTMDLIDGDAASHATWTPGAMTVYSDFDWTTAKSAIGYFEVTGSGSAAKATAKKQPTTISTDAQKAKTYLAVTIDANGSVAKISQRIYDSTDADGSGMKDTTGLFAGTITINAPTAYPLLLSRAALDVGTTIDASAKLAITGAVSGSVIDGLAKGDKVTTASLAVANAAKGIAAGTLRMETTGPDTYDVVYTAGAAGKLEITMQEVDEELRHTLTSGTALLSSAAAGEGRSYLYAGPSLIEVGNATELTVAAKSSVNRTTGVITTTYTIGGLGEGESFTVNGVSYKMSGSLLVRTTTDAESGKPIYATTKVGTTITSSVLTTESKWTPTVKTLDVEDDTTGAISSSNYKAIVTNLATLDSRIAKDKNKTNVAVQYDFVVDTYIAKPGKVQASLAAQVINNATYANIGEVQTIIGGASYNAVSKTWTYRATEDGTAGGTVSMVGQTITATKDWNVTGSDAADIINGASSSSKGVMVTINGGQGSDTITAGGATESFEFDFVGTAKDQDTLKKFGNNKDEIWIYDNLGVVKSDFDVDLMSNGSVALWNELDGKEGYTAGDEGVELVGMGNAQAVKINGRNFYFGNGKARAGTAAAFNYDTSGTAYYIANGKLTNTLRVATDNTKATAKTLGETVVIDLMKKGENDHLHYNNINIVDASASGNRVYLTAADTGSTLKGSKYQSTLAGGAGNDVLQGGTGADVFWFENGLDGSDTVKSYTSKNDAVYVGQWNDGASAATTANGYTIKVDGTNVVLTNDSGLGKLTIEKAVNPAAALKFSKDGAAGNTLSYYIGKNGTTNAKTGAVTLAKNTFTATLGTDTADSVAGATAGNFVSYYMGSDTATDTLKLVSAVGSDKKKKAVGTSLVGATFDMSAANSHVSSIDVLDATGLAGGSYVEFVGKASGTYSLIGSADKTSHETFNLSGLNTALIGSQKSAVTVTNFSVDDVIELAAGLTITEASKANAATAVINLSNDGGLTTFATLTLTKVKYSQVNYNATSGKMTFNK